MHAGIYSQSTYAQHVAVYVLLYHHVHVTPCKCVFINSCCACSGLIVLQCTSASAACDKRAWTSGRWKLGRERKKEGEEERCWIDVFRSRVLVGWRCSFILVWLMSSCVLLFWCSDVCLCAGWLDGYQSGDTSADR